MCQLKKGEERKQHRFECELWDEENVHLAAGEVCRRLAPGATSLAPRDKQDLLPKEVQAGRPAQREHGAPTGHVSAGGSLAHSGPAAASQGVPSRPWAQSGHAACAAQVHGRHWMDQGTLAEAGSP